MHSPAPEISLGKVFFKSTLLAILFVFITFLLLSLLAGIGIYRYVRTVTNSADTTPTALLQTVRTGMDIVPKQKSGKTVFLILGTDSLETRGDVPPLTDTMLLVSVEYKTGTIRQLSLPRDLWSEPYKTKINALYSYGPERTPENPLEFPSTALSELIGIPIDYTIVVDMDTIATIVDTIGGVQITIPKSFEDNLFPNPLADIATQTDPAVLYKSVKFSQGPQTLTGERFLEYIRSRHSAGEEGNDSARTQRQQLALSSLITTLQQSQLHRQPKMLGNMLKLYQDEFGTYLPLEEVIAIAYALRENVSKLAIEQHSLSIASEDNDGVIIHPKKPRKDGQWIYTVVNLQDFQEEVQHSLGIN